jgi:hypothetical protein
MKSANKKKKHFLKYRHCFEWFDIMTFYSWWLIYHKDFFKIYAFIYFLMMMVLINGGIMALVFCLCGKQIKSTHQFIVFNQVRNAQPTSWIS